LTRRARTRCCCAWVGDRALRPDMLISLARVVTGVYRCSTNELDGIIKIMPDMLIYQRGHYQMDGICWTLKFGWY
jgi:hypothetical protein